VTAHFELYRDAGGQWRWRLRARNGRIVADSAEGYASRRNARRAIGTTVDAMDEADRAAVQELAP
jgi:uncharacterized protein YegP (UPF0339 family)